MKITKLEHSGLVFEKNGETVVCDPAEFAGELPRLENVAAIIVTHKHGDHLQTRVIEKILSNNPRAKIFTASDTASLIDGANAVKSGDHCEVGGFALDFFGKDHAAVVAGQVPCDNIGVVMDETIVNPGDSFDLPDTRAKVLFVPMEAPWLKIAESIEFIDRARPEMVIPVHDAVLSDFGRTVNSNVLKGACDNIGAKFVGLKPGESVEV